jgi:hypothetical protein
MEPFCPAINAYRRSLIDGDPITRPVVQVECAPTFGASSNSRGSTRIQHLKREGSH